MKEELKNIENRLKSFRRKEQRMAESQYSSIDNSEFSKLLFKVFPDLKGTSANHQAKLKWVYKEAYANKTANIKDKWKNLKWCQRDGQIINKRIIDCP